MEKRKVHLDTQLSDYRKKNEERSVHLHTMCTVMEEAVE